MADINCISEKLVGQLKLLETSASETTHRFKDVESYINKRIKKLRKIIPLVSKSNDWAFRLSAVIDLFDDIQKVLEKVDELEGSIVSVQEVELNDDIELPIEQKEYDGVAEHLE